MNGQPKKKGSSNLPLWGGHTYTFSLVDTMVEKKGGSQAHNTKKALSEGVLAHSTQSIDIVCAQCPIWGWCSGRGVENPGGTKEVVLSKSCTNIRVNTYRLLAAQNVQIRHLQ